MNIGLTIFRVYIPRGYFIWQFRIRICSRINIADDDPDC